MLTHCLLSPPTVELNGCLSRRRAGGCTTQLQETTQTSSANAHLAQVQRLEDAQQKGLAHLSVLLHCSLVLHCLFNSGHPVILIISSIHTADSPIICWHPAYPAALLSQAAELSADQVSCQQARLFLPTHLDPGLCDGRAGQAAQQPS